jgi:hypothetical protein
MSRIEILKLLSWATGLQKNWLYKNDILALYGPNLETVLILASDITRDTVNQWWYAHYHTEACKKGIIECSEDLPFGPDEPCTIEWKKDFIRAFKTYFNSEGSDYFQDQDNDGLVNGAEIDTFFTDQTVADTDEDQIEDGAEVNIYKTNPNLEDTDGDKLNDGEEINIYGTDPLKEDTDGDRFSDYTEVVLGSDPLDSAVTPGDENGNGIDDAWELKYGIETVSGSADFDKDGVSNFLEYQYGTDPTNPDTDGDGINDADEIFLFGSDPLTPTDKADLGVGITSIKDGAVIATTRPFIQGFGPAFEMEIEVVLRNKFGHEILIGTSYVDENNSWTLVPEFDIAEGEFYIVAKGLDTKTRQIIESNPIRFRVDLSVEINEPVPERLADVTLDEDVILEGVRVIVRNNRPLVVGRTQRNNVVFATWESIVGTSAIVADLAEGEFEIEPPHNLELGEHRVYLYALRKEDNAMSNTVTVNFEIREAIAEELHEASLMETIFLSWFTWIIVGMVIFFGAIIGYRIMMARKVKKLE